MIPIPGWLVAIVTFPGVIVHEAAHFLMCRWRGIPVFDVCFFRVGNPAGYVAHAPIKDFTSNFLVCTGPFFINSLLCVAFCFPVYVPVKVFDQSDLLSYALIWLGVSIGMHAFPSTHDAANLWQAAKAELGRMNLLALLSFPLVILIYVANILSIIWFDYLYGIALGFGLPELFLRSVSGG
jgi:hypothetical protein